MIRKTFQGKRKVNHIEQVQLAIHHTLSSGVLSSAPTFMVDKIHFSIFDFKVILGHFKYIIFMNIFDCISESITDAEPNQLSSNL